MTRTHRRSVRGRLRRLRLPVLAAAAIFAVAGPAGATGVTQGAGAAVGYSTVDVAGGPPPVGLPCLKGAGGYETTIAAGEAAAVNGEAATGAYAGQLDVSINLEGDFWFNPAGVFSNASCTDPTGVDATITVASTGIGEGSVTDCSAAGTFARANTTIAFAGQGSCTVDGVTVPAVHTFVGNEYPCLTDPFTETSTCPSPVDTAHVVGVWTMAGATP